MKNIFSKNILTNKKLSNIIKTTKRKREQSKENEKVRTKKNLSKGGTVHRTHKSRSIFQI